MFAIYFQTTEKNRAQKAKSQQTKEKATQETKAAKKKRKAEKQVRRLIGIQHQRERKQNDQKLGVPKLLA